MIITVVLFAFLALLLAIPSILLHAWAITVLWAWFAVPTFQLSAIGFAQALGITLLVGIIHSQENVCKDERSYNEKAAAFVGMTLRPIVAVCIGWVVKLFI